MSQLADAAFNAASSSPSLQFIKNCVTEDFEAVNHLIINELISKVPLIQDICKHIINSGGKRLRPLTLLLSAKACGYQSGTAHHDLAAIVEFIHTATLLHDDVVDQSVQRRGQETANAIWGNQASVLVGDFLYSRAFQLITRHNDNAIMRVLASATNAIAEGEVMQLAHQHDPEITEAMYQQVITCKTAKLFEAAAAMGAIISAAPSQQIDALTQYGFHLGIAFQIIDDVLDYAADEMTLGKNLGDDLAEGKATLPLIYTLNHCDSTTANIIRQAIQTGNLDNFQLIYQAIKKTNALTYCYQQAQQHVNQAKTALEKLVVSNYRDALLQLANFTIERGY